MSAANVITIMACLILGTWIMMAPKDLPVETFNISVNGETRYYQQIRQGECARHISTARAMLAVFYTNSEIQQLMQNGSLDIKCIKLEYIKVDDSTNSEDPYAN